MAVTKHQFETSKIYNFNPAGKSGIDPIRISAIKPMTKNGKDILEQTLKNWDFEYKEKKSLTSKNSFLLNIKNIKKKLN